MFSKVTGEQTSAGGCYLKLPKNINAPGYSGCRQQPKTHRSKTHGGLHMHPKQSIPSPLPAQEALSLRPSAAFSGLLWVTERLDPRSRQRDAQGAPIVPAAPADIWDDVAHDPVGTMGCGSRGVCDVDGHAPCA